MTEWESKPEQVAFCHPYICVSFLPSSPLPPFSAELFYRTRSRYLADSHRDPQRLHGSTRASLLFLTAPTTHYNANPLLLQAQFITGSHMSLTYDGSAIASPSPSSSAASLSSPASSSSASSLSGSSSRPGDEKLADDLSFGPAGPIEKRLHVSIRQGAYHVLYEVVVVA